MDVEQLRYVSQLICASLNISVALLGEDLEIEFECLAHPVQNPMWSSKGDLYRELCSRMDDSDIPVMRTVNHLEKYFSICYRSWTLVVGPTVELKISENLVKRVLHDYKISDRRLEECMHYFTSVRRMSKLEYVHVSRLVHYLLYQQRLDMGAVIARNSVIEDVHVLEHNLDMQLSVQRQDDRYHNYLIEKALFGFIKEGDPVSLLSYLQLEDHQTGVGLLSRKSEIRNRKNLAICAVTLATRAAVDGGLEVELAYTMSDLFIQNLEELQDAGAVLQFLNNALYEFAERVRRNRRQMYTPIVRQCINYIFNHIYEKITVSDLADAVQLSPVYLSQRFHREVGVPLAQFIQQEKVEEAKRLLRRTGDPIAKISGRLKFSDQSHFTRVFKRCSGLTPRQFRIMQ